MWIIELLTSQLKNDRRDFLNFLFFLFRECFVFVVHATAMTVFAVLFMHVHVVTRFLMAGSPLLPWLAAIMTTRMTKEPVPLTEDDNREVLMKIECRSNLRSNTDTILFQVSARNLAIY